jgi:4,4'-diaponeurosporenoate glycosyltransferase
MIWLFLFCALGIPAGFLLLWKIPLCPNAVERHQPVSIVIPARNEEHNLPQLLGSIPPTAAFPIEVLVVDDASTDRTASVAQQFRATVIPALPLAPGWTGKTWACSQGADAAHHDLLLFLDADTWFDPQGLHRFLASRPANANTAVSILPYHVMHKPYEQLSLFFNLLMAIGAGGFGLIGPPRLFGQSLLIPRSLYRESGGHAAVRRNILENLALASHIRAAGAPCLCFCGRGTLNLRMFPQGLAQLCEGWTKAFADGAAASGPAVLGLSILWLTTLSATFLMLLLAPAPWRFPIAILYLIHAAQVWRFARSVGAYRAITCLLYPIPLLFYFGLFGQSLYLRAFKRKVQWRGRQL